MCDGAGSWLQSSGLRPSIAAHIIQQKPDCPLSESQEHEAWSIMIKTFGLGNAAPLLEVEPGQPLRLNLLQALATKIGDGDSALIPMLKAGVTTGVHEPIPSSLQWPKKAQLHQDFMPLEMCEGNWSAAEAKPSIVQSLINKEVASGWAAHPRNRTAALAFSHSSRKAQPGRKDPRLVLDSTVCQVNPNCSLPEAVQLPTVSDAFQPSDPHSMWMGASLDFKAAHKQVKVREQGQGMLLFEFAGQLYGYTVLPLWSPLLSLLVAAPWSLAFAHCTPAPCTTALLTALLRSSGDLQLELLAVVLVSWKKAALGDSLVWCGWKFNFRSETVSLEPDKLAKLAEQIQDLLPAKKQTRKPCSPALVSSTGRPPSATISGHMQRPCTQTSTTTALLSRLKRKRCHTRAWML